MSSPDEWHLVLGATAGIGRAYADHFARLGASLEIVARTAADLNRAAEEMFRLGASRCVVRVGDVLDERFRATLQDRLDDPDLKSVYVGGPSPRAVTFRHAGTDDYVDAAAIVVAYPLDILRRLNERESALTVVIVSSSAAVEPLTHRVPFFTSALLRRSLDAACAASVELFPPSVRVLLWHPRVVLTRLSTAYAIRDNAAVDAMSVLRQQFPGVEILGAAEFVSSVIGGVS
jgi:NADP-dependent 3-hydroxy acid dehydrogenase YdfG